MLATKAGTFLKAASSVSISSGICCAAITSIVIAKAKAASIKVSNRVISIPRSRNPRSRGSVSKSDGKPDVISSARVFIRLAILPQCGAESVQYFRWENGVAPKPVATAHFWGAFDPRQGLSESARLEER